MTAPARPGSAYLRTGKGDVVRAPHFIGRCRNCGEPAGFRLVDEERQPLRLEFWCAAVRPCGAKGSVEVDMRPGREGA